MGAAGNCGPLCIVYYTILLSSLVLILLTSNIELLASVLLWQ